MIVICPRCSTRYNLPDAAAKPDAKARCTVCKHIFSLAEVIPPASGVQDAGHVSTPAASDVSDIIGEVKGYNLDATPPKPEEKKRKRTSMVVALVMVLLVGAGAGAWKFWPRGADKAVDEAAQKLAASEQIKNIALRNVRQYYINNEKLGQVSVIEGRVVNNFTSPRELIKVEASLYDKSGATVVSKAQLCGTTVSLFHLQVLGEQELETALNNKIDILTNNTNIPPAGEVPFMVVFYNPPSTVTEFGVKVVEARTPPEKKQ